MLFSDIAIPTIISLMAVAGFTFYVRESDRGEWIRKSLEKWSYTEEMLHCAFCTGFWVALFYQEVVHIVYSFHSMGTLLHTPSLYVQHIVNAIVFAYAGAVAASLFDAATSVRDGILLGSTAIEAVTTASVIEDE